MSGLQERARVEAFVETLFTAGGGAARSDIKADRLVLWDDALQREIAGWCRDAIVRRVHNFTARETRAEVVRVLEEAQRAVSDGKDTMSRPGDAVLREAFDMCWETLESLAAAYRDGGGAPEEAS